MSAHGVFSPAREIATEARGLMPFSEIAARMSISQSVVRQTYNSALRKLRRNPSVWSLLDMAARREPEWRSCGRIHAAE